MSEFGPPPQTPSHPGPFLQGACAIHTTVVAMRTCARCGNFMCDECSENRTLDVCPPCRAIVGVGILGFPLHRDTWSIESVFTYGWNVFKRDWVLLSLAVLCTYIVSFAFSMLSTGIRVAVMAAGSTSAAVGVGFVLQLVQIVAQGYLQLGLIKMTLDAAQNRRVDFVDLFRQGRRLPAYVAQLFLLTLFIMIPLGLAGGAAAGIAYAASARTDTIVIVAAGAATIALLAIIPILIPFMFAQCELVFAQNSGPIQSLKDVQTIARDNRTKIFVFGLLGVPIMIGGLLLCCIGFFPAFALWQLLVGVLYLALRNGSGVQAA